jgi:cobalt/nickel transport system ATP-binding protein
MSCCVELRQVRFTYPDGRDALQPIDLDIGHGEKVALVGPNGAGKSTLILLMTGLLRGQGMIRLFGEELRDSSLRALRGRIGLVFQDPDDQLFSPTVFEDVAFGPLYAGLSEAEVRARASSALARVGLDGFEDRLSHHLSLGEKKRAAIATVLAMDPDLLILDEPTAGLDPRTRRRFVDYLRSLGYTLIVATHDLRLVADVLERTVVLDGGQKVEDGPSAEILEDRDLLLRHGLA